MAPSQAHNSRFRLGAGLRWTRRHGRFDTFRLEQTACSEPMEPHGRRFAPEPEQRKQPWHDRDTHLEKRHPPGPQPQRMPTQMGTSRASCSGAVLERPQIQTYTKYTSISRAQAHTLDGRAVQAVISPMQRHKHTETQTQIQINTQMQTVKRMDGRSVTSNAPPVLRRAWAKQRRINCLTPVLLCNGCCAPCNMLTIHAPPLDRSLRRLAAMGSARNRSVQPQRLIQNCADQDWQYSDLSSTPWPQNPHGTCWNPTIPIMEWIRFRRGTCHKDFRWLLEAAYFSRSA